MIIIPEKEVPEFKRLLVAYYEDKDTSEIMDFMRSKCSLQQLNITTIMTVHSEIR